ncbi:uncharacterized protein LOC118410371 [Branchiostoma floridae]|uniref:Uncharacterized protein LOC118410371 n=1 Tax=Branchiostoma floridae TaxID=7739 RepID=A0A9J7MHS7_BRAFL|nr:uncharacterized protein LOC118410371 [Branchiostoma floridae]
MDQSGLSIKPNGLTNQSAPFPPSDIRHFVGQELGNRRHFTLVSMGKVCCFGTCNSDSRYPERVSGVSFYPFPKPKTRMDACMRWIKACGRPHSQLNVTKITKDTYVCSKHFKDGRPTTRFPDPQPADGTDAAPVRTPMKRHVQQNECNKKPRLTPPIQESQLQGTPTEGSSSPSLRSIQRLKKENKDLKRENDDLKRRRKT